MSFVKEPAKKVEVVKSVDVCVLGAVRVMVNLNQVGEAAGVAAVLACNECVDVSEVDAGLLRKTLAEGGSIIV